jgi:hypothetical protein
VDGVDEWAAEGRSELGEGVDGVDDSGVCYGVEGVEPLADLVRDVDLPLGVRP